LRGCAAFPHRIIEPGEQELMKSGFSIAILLGGCLAAAQALMAQPSAPGSGQNQKPAASPNQNSGSPTSSRPSGGNPFPEDETSIPVLPSRGANVPPDLNGAGSRISLPADDTDPVRSPDEPATDNAGGFSSSLSGLGGLTSGPDDEQPKGRKKKDDQVIETMPRETPKEDINVGNYYLDIKDWKGALSRFQSALVLTPDDPDVYWGLAECQRHLGDFAEARANYIKVMEYDPGSRHAKDAKKALKDPEIANAKPDPGK
jgi:tetratricopeptide (TPR) repeat protein